MLKVDLLQTRFLLVCNSFLQLLERQLDYEIREIFMGIRKLVVPKRLEQTYLLFLFQLEAKLARPVLPEPAIIEKSLEDRKSFRLFRNFEVWLA